MLPLQLLSRDLGPANSCLIAIDKKTFPTSVFKARCRRRDEIHLKLLLLSPRSDQMASKDSFTE